jgi:hypothetical protein
LSRVLYLGIEMRDVVRAFLAAFPGEAYCTPCLMHRIGATRLEIDGITSAVRQPALTVTAGRCAGCGRQADVLLTDPSAHAADAVPID